MHVEMTVNICVGYIGWKAHARWEQQAQHNHQEQQSTMNSIVNREAIERINRTRLKDVCDLIFYSFCSDPINQISHSYIKSL